MAPGLSAGGRLRSRTSDISDLLRGRHDPKTSTDSQLPPPVPPHQSEPAAAPKLKGKFSFLARKRKPSAVSPAPARAATDAAQRAKGKGKEGASPVPAVGAAPGGHLPTPSSGASSSPQKATSSSLPPVDVSPPSLALPQFEGISSKSDTLPRSGVHQRIPSGIPTATLRSLRPQQSTSFEQIRRSNDSQVRKHSSSSSTRPIITISPPRSVTERTDAFNAPRSAPRPPSNLPSRQPSQSGKPAPTPTLNERTRPESPTSDSGSRTSIQSTMQFPIPSVDPPSATSSYKEESLLRKDHFEVGASDLSPGQRRGTVSGNNQSTLGSMGRSIMQERLQRRHVSVLYMGKPKQEAAGKTTTPPRVRRPSPRHTDSPSSSGQSGNESTASSKGIAVSPLLRSRSTSSPIVKKVPPPLMRTWHTPPTTGPPTEPLPSPPTSATLQPLLLSSTPRASAPAISPPPSPQKDLPSLPRKDASPTRTSSGAVGQTPPSPLRTAREASGSPALARTPTPMRQDAVRKVLEDENATAEELREALSTQTAKYSRLMAYLLTLTERHGMEKNEFLRRIETLEAEAQRRERELKGLRWLVANANQGGSAGQQGEKRPAGPHPVRADSATLPGSESRSRQRSASESVVGTSAGVRMATGMSASPNPGAGVLDMMRLSIDSPSGSTEDGLLEMQTAISELIAPFISPPTSDASHSGETQGERGTGTQSESLSSSARLRRSNTLPDASLAHLPAVSSKQARRTSSPVLLASNSGSPAKPGAPLARRPAAATGLGFGFELSKGESSSPPRADRDPHARSDSSTLSSVPTLSTFSSSSALSSIPETPRTEMEFSPAADSARKSSSTKQSEEMARRSKTLHRHSGSSLSSSTSSGTGKFTTSSRVSTSPSIAQVLDRGSRQPEMDAILRKLRAFGHREGSP